MVDLDDYAAARRYLAPFDASLWRWDEEAQVVEWVDGFTVAFRGEIEYVVRRLAPHGLPPMTALVLLLAACRENWGEIAGRLGTTAGLVASVQRSDLPVWLPEILDRLDVVHALDAELRQSPEAKATLAEAVFENSPFRTSSSEAAAITRGLAACPDPGMLALQHRRSRGFDDALRELRCLHDGLASIDAESLRLRRRTGLDQLVRPAPIDLAPADRVRRLIAELRNDEELGGLSRMAGQLLAAMHLPRPIADHEDLPVGGVSDISNRGPLDRLLLGELAHDDLTLAVRIAVGEALYLRREAPPRNPPRHRAVLIDAGIRLWGVPRVFATAVAMAMAATAERHIQVDVYRADGDRVVPVDFTQREGLVKHMEALAPDAHPGNALQAFLAAVSARGEFLDIVVVTAEDVAADAEFRQALAGLKAPLLLATVSRDGRFRLVSRGPKSAKVISEARLDLDELLAPRRTAPRLIDEGLHGGLPAIFGVRPFPLLLGYQPIDPHRHWAVDKGVLGISPQRCLMYWQRQGHGARWLADNMPNGPVQWAGPGAEISTSLTVVGQLQQKTLWVLSVDLAADCCRVTPLEAGPRRPIGVSGHGGMIFVIYPDHVDVIEPATGARVQSPALPAGVQWRRDRFFVGGNGDWHALAFDGVSARLQPILAAHDARGGLERYLTFVEVTGDDGPIGVTANGNLYHSIHKRQTPVLHGLPGRIELRAVARNGQRVIVSDAKDQRHMALIDVPLGTSCRVTGDPFVRVEREVERLVSPRSLRQRLVGLCLDDERRLTLVSAKGKYSGVELDRQRHHVALRPGEAGRPTERKPLWFRPVETPVGGPVLQVATWEDGSCAMFDPRGMLHLKSSDPSIPELTLVLSDGPMAGWCADGRIWGPSYFTGAQNTARSGAVYTEILEPFLARLP